MRKIIIYLGFLSLIILLNPSFALAQAPACACPNPCANPCVDTALGCINTEQNCFVGTVLGWAIMAGGGIAFLLMIFGGFGIITSSGNPENVKKGTETITSAIQGLLFIILSLFLLKLIGVNLFAIPGF